MCKLHQSVINETGFTRLLKLYKKGIAVSIYVLTCMKNRI